jgi:hypothetical protein
MINRCEGEISLPFLSGCRLQRQEREKDSFLSNVHIPYHIMSKVNLHKDEAGKTLKEGGRGRVRTTEVSSLGH